MAKSKIIKVSGNGSWTGQYGTFFTFEYESNSYSNVKNKIPRSK